MSARRAAEQHRFEAADLAATSAARDFASEAEAQMPAPERLAERIAIAIQSGQVLPGQRLREQDLSAMFGTSRGPVREALRILEGDGFVELEPHRGAVVSRASDHETEIAVEMQIALFGVAARTVATSASESAVDELAAVIDELAALEADAQATPEQFVSTSLRATWLLIHIARSSSLARAIRSLRRLTRPDRWIFAMTTKPKQRKAVRQWQGILTAIREKNPGRAETLAKTRVRQLHKVMSAPE